MIIPCRISAKRCIIRSITRLYRDVLYGRQWQQVLLVHSYRTCQTVSPKLNNELFYTTCFIMYIKYILYIFCISRRF